MSSFRVPVALGFSLLLLGAQAWAQGQSLTSAGSFELPVASPRVHGFVGRVLSARRGDSRFGEQHEGEVVLGENFPLITIRGGARPIVFGLGSQVYGRFSLSDSKSALISTDWVVGLNTTMGLSAWALTLELYHESSHLGDEYGDRFPEDRIDWTREVMAGWASFGSGAWRFTAGARYTLADELNLPGSSGAFGIDYHGALHPFLGGFARPIAGLFTEADAATRWRLSTSAKLGVALASGEQGHDISLSLIAHDGLSTQRQFFRQESRYVGFEVRFDL
jgi:hypothetical protein